MKTSLPARTALCVTALLALALPAPAEVGRLGLSLGALDGGGAEVYLRYQTAARLGPFHYAFGASLSDHREAWVGAGLLFEEPLGRSPFFVQVSVLPGFYDRGRGKNLGGHFQIRSGIDLGYQFAGGARLSVGLDHRSDAGTTDLNPGLNTVQVRYAVPLGR